MQIDTSLGAELCSNGNGYKGWFISEEKYEGTYENVVMHFPAGQGSPERDYIFGRMVITSTDGWRHFFEATYHPHCRPPV